MSQYVNGIPVNDRTGKPSLKTKPLPVAGAQHVGKVLRLGDNRYICIKSGRGGYGWVPYYKGGE